MGTSRYLVINKVEEVESVIFGSNVVVFGSNVVMFVPVLGGWGNMRMCCVPLPWYCVRSLTETVLLV